MRLISQMLDPVPEFQILSEFLANRRAPVLVTGLQSIHKAHLCACLASKLKKIPVYIAADEREAAGVMADLSTMLDGEVLYYPYRDMVFYNVDNISRDWTFERIKTLTKLLDKDCAAVVTLPEAALQYTLTPEVLRKNTVLLTQGDDIDADSLPSSLVAAGYQRARQVEGPGQFSVRGGIIDIFSPGTQSPVRLELFGDMIDSMGEFDVLTQRRTKNLKRANICPAWEILYSEEQAGELYGKIEGLAERYEKKSPQTSAYLRADLERLREERYFASIDKFLPLIYKRPATLFDYLSGDSFVMASEKAKTDERLRHFFFQHNEDTEHLLETGRLCGELTGLFLPVEEYLPKLTEKHCIFADTFATDSFRGISLAKNLSFSAGSPPGVGPALEVLIEELREYKGKGKGVIVFTETQKRAANLAFLLTERQINAKSVEDASALPVSGEVFILQGRLSSGLDYGKSAFAVLSDSQNVGSKPSMSKKRERKITPKERLRTFTDLSKGDYVVHINHGIGQFMGIHKLTVEGVTKDYIKIRYAGEDMLYVPCNQLDLISKYIGAKEGAAKLSKMGGVAWEKQKQRVRGSARDMAKKLLELYALRSSVKGYAFSEDGQWQRDFESLFDFEETEDQLRCVREIKADMQRSYPMDRLLCGDVGFGKTEVALRAAFKAVLDGKQVAILVPTTILAWQHFNTMMSRMTGFPIQIEMLSRFRSPKEQREVIKKLRQGGVDIVVGTHRLLQKDLLFKDLGLVIVDEEQRFGVGHKEKLKELTKTVDVLTLTATPIPRTLYMALSGIRDMSTLEEAPGDRHPVQTYVLEHDWGILNDAIRRELRRGGQVFYLHNRVESISRVAAKIAQMPEGPRVAIAHGQMEEGELSAIWEQTVKGEIDVLVCTTIIETGIDIPNANTLIIEDADKMGLSQMHQIRGRVGRSTRSAFAYLTYHKGKILTEIAAKRLAAIREFTEFGSGFKIAMRDLEIRGAGNILGAEQHGHMESVGYEVYLKLLDEALHMEKGEPQTLKTECMVDVFVDAHIPEKYIESAEVRIDIYQKIASIETPEDFDDLLDELLDRFGAPPASVKNLMDIALLRNNAGSLGLSEISEKNGAVLLFPSKPDLSVVSCLSGILRGRVMFTPASRAYISIKMKPGQKSMETVREALEALAQCALEEPLRES